MQEKLSMAEKDKVEEVVDDDEEVEETMSPSRMR
jgi:hypothetical protein